MFRRIVVYFDFLLWVFSFHILAPISKLVRYSSFNTDIRIFNKGGLYLNLHFILISRTYFISNSKNKNRFYTSISISLLRFSLVLSEWLIHYTIVVFDLCIRIHIFCLYYTESDYYWCTLYGVHCTRNTDLWVSSLLLLRERYFS